MYKCEVITDFDRAETVSAAIRNFHTGIIGFDTETSHRSLQSDPIDVIQICVPGSNDIEPPLVYIFHVAVWPRIEGGKYAGNKKLPDSLSKIISSKRIVKVVSAPENDSNWLWKAFGVKLLGVIDIQSIAMLKGETAYGLDSLASKYLDGWSTKSTEVKLADWSKKLTPSMIKYAADDAYASYALMRILEPSFGSRKQNFFGTAESLIRFVTQSEESLKKSGLLDQEKKSVHKIVSKILESLPEITDDLHRRDMAKVIFEILQQKGVVLCA